MLKVYNVQNAFHQNLMQMRETARASIQSLPNHGTRGGDHNKGDLLDESHSFNVGQKTLGGRSEFDERRF